MPVNPISAAVSLYLGHGLGPSPQEDASRLTSRFGYDAPHLENQVRSLLAELDKIRPDWNAHTLLSGSQWAVAQLRCAHPELDDDAGTALIWAYSWWWR